MSRETITISEAGKAYLEIRRRIERMEREIAGGDQEKWERVHAISHAFWDMFNHDEIIDGATAADLARYAERLEALSN